MKSVLFSVLAVGVAGCTSSPVEAQQVTSERFTYACAGGKTFHVAFDAGFTYARVTTARASFRLPAVMAASGSRYTDNKVEFWEHHGEAMLNGIRGDTFADCKLIDPA
jgi:membrane-bound inhibitor of C-type lysozyme